jgi:predicted ATPase
MGVLWAILDGTGPLLLEEPELSLHPEVVRYIPQMFARTQRITNRQVLTSTHSTELLSDDGITLQETLIFLPKQEGTSVSTARETEQVARQVEGGSTIAEAVMPLTRPLEVQQLSFFAEQ